MTRFVLPWPWVRTEPGYLQQPCQRALLALPILRLYRCGDWRPTLVRKAMVIS